MWLVAGGRRAARSSVPGGTRAVGGSSALTTWPGRRRRAVARELLTGLVQPAAVDDRC